MRNKWILILMLVFSVTVQAQDARVAEIRKLYAEVKENMEYRKKAEIPPNDMVVTMNYMAPGAGPINDVTHYFYDGEFKEDVGSVVYCPTFIERLTADTAAAELANDMKIAFDKLMDRNN